MKRRTEQMRVDFHTQLSVEECQQRLHQAFSVKRKILWGVFVDYGPVRGGVKGSKFHMYRIPRYRNLFFPFLFGTLASETKGTVIRAKIRFPIASIILAPFSYW